MNVQEQGRQPNVISRKNLVSSLITGLIIGVFAGMPLGWLAHRFYADQRLAQVMICREHNRNQPAATLEAICGSGF